MIRTRALVRRLMADGCEFNRAANEMQEFAEQLEYEAEDLVACLKTVARSIGPRDGTLSQIVSKAIAKAEGK